MSRTLCCLACLALSFPGAAIDPDPDPNPFMNGWGQPVDPDGDCLFRRKMDGLTSRVPGSRHDFDVFAKPLNSPRLLRDVEGDFAAEVRVGGNFTPSLLSTDARAFTFLGAGFLLLADEKTFVLFE